MKALVWKAIDEVAIEEIPEPEKSDMAIVRISYTGICGSDITIKSGKHPRARPRSFLDTSSRAPSSMFRRN